MYHKVIIVGNLGGDPEMRFTQAGDPVTTFSVAVNEGYGEKKRTAWFRVSAWRKLAEVCNEYLKSGKQVLVEGTLTADETGGPCVWKGKDGDARASFELTAREVRFLGKKDEVPF